MLYSSRNNQGASETPLRVIQVSKAANVVIALLYKAHHVASFGVVRDQINAKPTWTLVKTLSFQATTVGWFTTEILYRNLLVPFQKHISMLIS